MLTAHETVAFLAIGASLAAAVAGFAAYRSPRGAGRWVTHLLALAQTVLVAQVALGLLLLSEERRTGDQLHYLYGTLALGAVIAPWLYAPLEPRRRLLWFAVATLLAAALAARAYMTAS